MEAYVLPSDLRKCSSMKTSQLTGERLSPTALFITISPLLCILLMRFLIGGGGAFVITLGRVFRLIGASLPFPPPALELCWWSITAGDPQVVFTSGCRSDESFRRTVMSSGVSGSRSIGVTGGTATGSCGRCMSYTIRSYLIDGCGSGLSWGPAPGSRIILRRVCTNFFSVAAFGGPSCQKKRYSPPPAVTTAHRSVVRAERAVTRSSRVVFGYRSSQLQLEPWFATLPPSKPQTSFTFQQLIELELARINSKTNIKTAFAGSTANVSQHAREAKDKSKCQNEIFFFLLHKVYQHTQTLPLFLFFFLPAHCPLWPKDRDLFSFWLRSRLSLSGLLLFYSFVSCSKGKFSFLCLSLGRSNRKIWSVQQTK